MAISIADLIKQNTLGQSEGFPLGVPRATTGTKAGMAGDGNASRKLHRRCGLGASLPGSGATGVFDPNATVQVANAQTYVHIKATGPMGFGRKPVNNPIDRRPFCH